MRGEKVASAQDFGWQSKGEGHFESWFPFFFVYLVTIMYCSDIVWSKDLSGCFFFFRSLIENFSFFFFFFTLSLEFSFCFVSSPFLGFGILSSFFVSSPFLGSGIFLLFVFSSEGKDYGELGFWLKACRTAGHDTCQDLASGSGIKGMSPHYSHDTQATNDD